MVESDLPSLVRELSKETGRSGVSEQQAWRDSFGVLSEALDEPYFDRFHLYFGGKGALALEYRLPHAPGWCDVVMLGEHDGRSSAVILELKHWNTTGDQPGRYEGLISRRDYDTRHPSDQVRGYVEYCRNFHSAIADTDAKVSGCAFFTTSANVDVYKAQPNHSLVQEYPVFSAKPKDLARGLPEFLKARLNTANEAFAEAFNLGRYRQPRSLCIQVGALVADRKSSPFVLLDEQRTAFARTMAEIEEAVRSGDDKRRVVIVHGPPGSGKSVVAAQVWARLATDWAGEDRSVALVTTSASQSSNWQSMFQTAAGRIAARNFVLKANNFIPLTVQRASAAANEHGFEWHGRDEWHRNQEIIRKYGLGRRRMPDREIDVAICDEAHALINTESSDASGMLGFPIAAGPQAYHVIRGSRVSVFLLDPEQSFREKETTSVADIERFAQMLDVSKITHVDLSDNQFRCGGSVEYTRWVDQLLAGAPEGDLRNLAREWHTEGVSDPQMVADAVRAKRRYHASRHLDLRLMDSPIDLEETLRERIAEGFKARLLSSYSVPWVTKGVSNPHAVAPEARDFYFDGLEHGMQASWSRVWNVLPGSSGNYAPFVQGVPGTGIHEDPLSEVGCPYVVRGFDFDYVGLIWLEDLRWDPEAGRWRVDLDSVYETGLTRHRQRAANGSDEAIEALQKQIAQAYRILLTRPIHGIYIWARDTDTRQHLQDALTDER